MHTKNLVDFGGYMVNAELVNEAISSMAAIKNELTIFLEK